MPVAALLTAALVLLKVLGYIDVSWWLVLAPIIAVWVLILLFVVFGAAILMWLEK